MQVTIEWNWINHIVVILHTLAYLIWFCIYLDIVLHSCWIWLKMSPKTVANAMIKSFSFLYTNAQCTHTHELRDKNSNQIIQNKRNNKSPKSDSLTTRWKWQWKCVVTPPQKTVLFRTKVYHNKHKMCLTERFLLLWTVTMQFLFDLPLFLFYFILSIDCIFFRRILVEYFTWIWKQ